MATASPKESFKTVALRVLSMEKILMAAHIPKTPFSLSKNLLNLKKSPCSRVNLLSHFSSHVFNGSLPN